MFMLDNFWYKTHNNFFSVSEEKCDYWKIQRLNQKKITKYNRAGNLLLNASRLKKIYQKTKKCIAKNLAYLQSPKSSTLDQPRFENRRSKSRARDVLSPTLAQKFHLFPVFWVCFVWAATSIILWFVKNFLNTTFCNQLFTQSCIIMTLNWIVKKVNLL